MEMGRNLEHITERLTEGLRCPWKWGLSFNATAAIYSGVCTYVCAASVCQVSRFYYLEL